MSSSVLVITLCFCLCIGIKGEFVGLYTLDNTPIGWKEKAQHVIRNERMEITWFLQNQNTDKLSDILWSISDPSSSEYGKHLSKEELLDLVSPPIDVSHRIVEWIENTLGDHAMHSSIENKRDVIVVQSTVAGIEKVFNTQICLFESANGEGRYTLRQCTGSKSFIHSKIRAHVALVDGLVHFPVQKLKPIQGSTAVTYNIPSTIRAMYNIPNDTQVTHPNATQCVLGSYMVGVGLVADLNMFDELNEISPQPLTIVGPPLLNYSENIWLSVENALDTQYMTGMAPNATTIFWTYDVGYPTFFSQLLHANNTPLVVSMSYGEQEPLNDTALLLVMEQELMKLGARGITVIASSGDTGALGLNYNCSGDPTANGYFLPSYPATSPYILAVGSTAVYGNGPMLSESNQPPICTSTFPCTSTPASEVPADLNNARFSSGGGFSAFFSQPSYQAKSVNAYLALPIAFPPSTIWNKTNRGFPDVAAIGQNVLIVNGSKVEPQGGTSASAPMFGGIVTLLNDFLLRNNKNPLGWINPLLYQMAEQCPQCFNQLVETSLGEFSDACSSVYPNCCAPQGFLSGSIKSGMWDPLTGLGTINFQETIQYLAQLHKISVAQ